MDDKTQKERLEQELRFLKESFDAEVISKDEFEKGKDRVEKKLKEIQEQEPIPEKQQKEEQKKEDVTEKREEEKIKLKVIQDESEEHEYSAPLQIIPNSEEETRQNKKEEPKKESKFFKYAVVFIVLMLVAFFSYSFIKNKPAERAQEIPDIKFVAACSSNFDCKQEGKKGICLNPGAKDARCEFKEIEKINVIVLNDRKNCFNCGVQRVLSILENWFGAINVNEIDYNTEKGKSLAEKFDANLLPMYILDEDITKIDSFEKFKQAFVKKDSSFLLNDDAAGSTLYVKRENIPNKLDLFVKSGSIAGIKAENNLKEFLAAFEEVKFERHLSADNLAQELNIKAFPTFLINNKIKFSGVVTADTIKSNFCEMNKLPECEKSLSKSLV